MKIEKFDKQKFSECTLFFYIIKLEPTFTLRDMSWSSYALWKCITISKTYSMQKRLLQVAVSTQPVTFALAYCNHKEFNVCFKSNKRPITNQSYVIIWPLFIYHRWLNKIFTSIPYSLDNKTISTINRLQKYLKWTDQQ